MWGRCFSGESFQAIYTREKPSRIFDISIGVGPACRPNANAYVKYSRGLFRSMDGLDRLSMKASTPRRPYRTLNQPYMSQSGQFPRYRKIPKIRIPHKVILTWTPLKGADGPVIYKHCLHRRRFSLQQREGYGTCIGCPCGSESGQA